MKFLPVFLWQFLLLLLVLNSRGLKVDAAKGDPKGPEGAHEGPEGANTPLLDASNASVYFNVVGNSSSLLF